MLSACWFLKKVFKIFVKIIGYSDAFFFIVSLSKKIIFLSIQRKIKIKWKILHK